MPRMKPLIAALLLAASASALATGPEWQISQVRPGIPATAASWYWSGSALSRGIQVPRGFLTVYTVYVIPGLQYTLQLSAPASPERLTVYLCDRWPLLGGRHTRLPAGPVVARPHGHRLVYRWHIGIAPASTSGLLYVLVRAPSHGHHPSFLPRLLLVAPPLASKNLLGRGITYLQGPSNFLLRGDTGEVSYVVHASDAVPNDWQPPGDLIANGDFTQGLEHWRASGGEAGIAAGTDGLALGPGTTPGIVQAVDRDVTGATSLLLWADVGIDTHAGAKPPRLVVSVCYLDQAGKRHCGDKAFRVLFPQGTKTTPHWPAAGQWYRYQTDLTKLRPAVARVESVALDGRSLDGGRARIRGIHLILRSEKQP